LAEGQSWKTKSAHYSLVFNNWEDTYTA
jgi:hypothetical protein